MQKRIIKSVPSLTIAIPAFNEEKNIEIVLKDILHDAPKYLSNYEVIIVDDGSTDKTGMIAASYAKKYKNIRVFHQKNKGYGAAMLRGIRAARKDFVCYMAADGQFLLKDMQYCIPLMKEADLILGARGSRADYSTYRLILSYGYLILLRILFDIRFQDINWLTIWRTKEVQKLHIDSKGVFLLAEIVVRFQQKRLVVVEAPSFYRPRKFGQEKNSKPSIAMRTLLDACKLWFKINIFDKGGLLVA